ncbi:XshC-Cox1 family protein [Erwinia sp. OLTSP20]|uniref:XdhC family protein n=1 Tax=unclassified Erwinia TaxID=2622719 RepID=UPI000C19ABFF|nr:MULTISPECIES: XdhC family protein [unclassified Erwinia]PIJ48483.1 XshC-Cox1 family protein [Erwinia sp. OAMSP11]PIJ75979.1 XshC-Cox1 family protein [Erwinia sp. OLSSP12]PIJ78879.1 XshC-Cox1 family protein [Erwinia sp. OLCASP19]PIJ87431.1 XshC-Cox1 family protein [Erwinia sp. OLMTSP26]PIJ88981.1 XshC-Cox1 family protein [Erwinia sp. OLMDSP33]
MQHLDITVIHQALDWLQHRPVWLCTVLNTYGSAPRSPGSMMVADARHHFCGSLSGGCIEEDFLQRIAGGEFQAASQVVRYGEGGLTPDITLPCGGSLDILIEYLTPDDTNRGALQQISAALTGHYALEKSIILPYACQLNPSPGISGRHQVMYDECTIRLYLAAPPQLLIAGLSSVALYCAEFASALGFHVVVCENRSDVLDSFAPQLKPDITLHRQFPAKYIEQNGCHAATAVVALTHDPRMDDLTLMEAIGTPAFYLGAMGSQRNSTRRLQRLQTIAGFTPAQLARIHAPIGLALGSKTPAEIALAVMADIVRYKNHSLASSLPVKKG